MGAASAADVSSEPAANYTGDVPLGASEDTGGADVIGAPSEGNNVLGAGTGTFTTLNKTINSHGDNEIVTLDLDYTYNNDTDYAFINGIVINQNNFAVDGNGITIDGNSLARIFTITGNNVTLKNINFINGNATSGGAILWNGKNAFISNSIFTHNNASSAGGALFYNGNSIIIEKCTFESNNATGDGGAVCIPVSSSSDKSIICNSTFNNNYATYGAAIYTSTGIGNKVLIDIKNLKLKGNAAYISTIYIGSGTTANITNITLTNNIGLKNDNGEDGSIISTRGGSKVNLTDFTLDNNTGTALRTYGTSTADSYITLENTNITNNNGLAIDFLNDNVDINNLNLQNNTGGSVIRGNNVSISDSTFTNNLMTSYMHIDYQPIDKIVARLTGSTTGIIVENPDSVTLSNNKYWDGTKWIEVNIDEVSEINLTNMKINIIGIDSNNITIINITNQTDNEGCVSLNISKFTSSKILFVATFDGNEYYLPSEDETTIGGGDFFYLQKLIIDNVFLGNKSIELTRNYTYTIGVDNIIDGVGINVDNLTIDGKGFTIDALGMSRIFKVQSQNITLKNINFVNGNTSQSGGAIYSADKNLTLDNCLFINNTATTSGGAIYLTGGSITDCNFINNTAGTYGGAIFKQSNYAMSIENSKFKDNNANEGGAIYLRNLITIMSTINNCTFTNNSATSMGGALRTYSTVGFKLENSNFTDNNASNSGAVMLFGVNSIIDNCNFINNSASDAGALRIYNNNITVKNSNFINNSATNQGGAILSDNGNYRFIYECTFENNSAKSYGAVKITGNNVVVDYCDFTNNTASNSAGALYVNDYIVCSNTIFKDNRAVNNAGALQLAHLHSTSFTYDGITYSDGNVSFINNVAGNEGGALYISAGYAGATITNYKFINNSATNGGAVADYHARGAETITFKDSNFTDNTATGYGGAIYLGLYGKLKLVNVNLTHNRAGSELILSIDGTNVTAHLVGYNNQLNAIYSKQTYGIIVNNVTYWDGEKYTTTANSDQSISLKNGKNTDLVGATVNITVYTPSETRLNTSKVTNESAEVNYDYARVGVNGALVLFLFEGNECYYRANATLTVIQINTDLILLKK